MVEREGRKWGQEEGEDQWELGEALTLMPSRKMGWLMLQLLLFRPSFLVGTASHARRRGRWPGCFRGEGIFKNLATCMYRLDAKQWWHCKVVGEALSKWFWENWPIQNKQRNEQTLDPYLTPYIRINPNWIEDLNVKGKIINLLEDNRGEGLYNHRVWKYFLNMIHT